MIFAAANSLLLKSARSHRHIRLLAPKATGAHMESWPDSRRSTRADLEARGECSRIEAPVSALVSYISLASRPLDNAPARGVINQLVN
jgi:hypothetical protein